ncbi:bifunctional tetrahydrofolate synthase/dihydrofolate synthase [Endozoicomonadaceae bacterium StTr2]
MKQFETLGEWLHWLETRQPEHHMKFGLERIMEVADRLQLAKPAPLVITVAGTNGKGSTVCYLDTILRTAGYKTAAFTSPHFLQYNERIQVNGAQASDEQICDAFNRITQTQNDTFLSYFEFTALAAFLIFSEADIDVALLEVGLGGRLDAVNMIDPDIAIVTSIARDHEQWLGSDLNGIAREKAGIFRTGVPAVSGQADAPKTIETVAIEVEAPLYRREREFDITRGETCWSWKGRGACGNEVIIDDLPYPELPLDNAATVLQALQFAGLNITDNDIRKGIGEARLTGRFQNKTVTNSRGEQIPVILDVAHNPQAAEMLASRLKNSPVEGQTLAVFGVLDDKDPEGIVEAFLSQIDKWFIGTPESPRALNPTELKQYLEGSKVNFVMSKTIPLALQNALEKATTKDRIIVFGSFTVISEVLDEISSR